MQADTHIGRNAYRYQVLENAVREHEVCAVFRALRSVQIEPILLKGWSVARHYVDPSLRPLGDIDLLIADEQLPAAVTKLTECGGLNIDWHSRSKIEFEFSSPEEVVGRSQLALLLDTDVRVFCPEDSLHFVSVHMLRHGGWSSVWVRDVAVLLASREVDFDWDICLGSDPTRAGWVLSAIVLAHRLVGADIRGTPAEKFQIPNWLERAARRAQTNPDPADNQPPEGVWDALTHPWRVPQGLRKRWPDPISAAVMTGAAFDDCSPFVHQLGYSTTLTANFVRRFF